MQKLKEKSHMKKNKMKIIEQWKPIDGYEGLYEVSSLGRVKSLKYGKEKIMKSKNDRGGYLYIGLRKDGKQKFFKIHRLVAEAFIPNQNNLPQVNHKDEDKTNNCASNLEFCDCKYNINYGHHNEKVSASMTNHPALSKPVEASKYPNFRTIELRFSSTREADRNGYPQSHVADCCRGCYCSKGNFYKNLYWRYAK